MPALVFHRDAAAPAAYAEESHLHPIMTTTGIFGALALVAFVLRIYVRAFLIKCAGADDLFLAIAMLMGCAVYACFIGESMHGLGQHASVIAAADKETFLHWQYYQGILVTLGTGATKVSVALLLQRFVQRQGYRRFLWGTVVFVVVFTLGCLGTLIFSCVPVAGYWNPAVAASAKCLSRDTVGAIGVTNSSVNILLDVLLSLLPIPIISSMTLGWRTKTALNMVLGLGLLAIIASALKIQAQTVFLTDHDSTFHDRFAVFGTIELYLGIMAASCPALKPLFVAFMASARTDIDSTTEQKLPPPYQKHSLRKYGYQPNNDSMSSPDDHATSVIMVQSPRPAHDRQFSRERYYHLGIAKKGPFVTETECSRSDSLPPLDRILTQDASHSSAAESEEKNKLGCIVRTTKVMTQSELVAQTRPVERIDTTSTIYRYPSNTSSAKTLVPSEDAASVKSMPNWPLP